MGNEEKADATKDKFAGKIKEGAGKVTGDKQTEAEGKSQAFQGKVKDGVENVKDTAKGFTEGFRDDKKN